VVGYAGAGPWALMGIMCSGLRVEATLLLAQSASTRSFHMSFGFAGTATDAGLF
jgi:hypothetical protein